MGEARLQLSQETRQLNGHAEDLVARGQLDRLDAVGDELGVARDRGETNVWSAPRKPAEELADVRLVARAPAAERIGVDEDHAAASR